MSCKRIRIGSLFPGVSISPTVIGLVIKKQDPRNLKSTSGDRWVFNLTIRDSPYDTANVSFWGSQQFVIQVDSQIEVGSIVGITNVKLSPASPGGDQYKPKVTCGSHLQVSENGGEIQVYDKNHELLGYGMGEMLKQLIHLPNGPVQESLTVADIRAGSEGLDRSSANLLVAVQKVGAERIFRTRDGRDAVRLDVTCFDQSGCNLHLVMWDRCDIQFAKTWVPFQTILFISDACLKWDTFRCGLIVQLTSRSICTVQPDCEEGRNLLQYAISAEGLLDDIVDEGSRFEPDFNTDLSKISRIFNVEQLKEVTSQIGKGRHLDAVLYCFFSEFDIDSENTSIFSGSWFVFLFSLYTI
ncbi:hypothetical protein QYM36_001338 [Artemia franciscana]|uniref:MEIOB-like N-terminal domain-containing protein n=1 Tax=Artemia franciscana TaxID=6661 RepID=A0AA88IJB7_ARTSF|nr:hypothetical protein QYM36_001338 [Artemia franciscana]